VLGVKSHYNIGEGNLLRKENSLILTIIFRNILKTKDELRFNRLAEDQAVFSQKFYKKANNVYVLFAK